MEVQVSIPLAFAAGLVSVLSACVLPLVPGYLAFVTALALDARSDGSARDARVATATYSALFLAGFGLVFLTLGLVATPVGPPIARSLPWIQAVGGALLAVWGVYLLGVLAPLGFGRPSEAPRGRGTRAAGSLFTGMAFGAAWTPCIGPVLGSILLYVTREPTMAEGGVLLLTYALGLGLPFLGLSVALNWPLVGSRDVERWIRPLRRLAGGVLVALGIALVTGYFARLTAFLAGLGQLINLEL